MNLRNTFMCLGLAAGLVAAACQSDSAPTGPADDSTPSFAKKGGKGAARSPDLDASDASTGLHLVVFKSGDRVPADLSRAVKAAGGSVETAYSKFGFATVAGLDDSGVAALLARKDVAYVEADQLMQLDVPEKTEPTALDDAGVTSIDDPTTALLFFLQWNMRAIFADVA